MPATSDSFALYQLVCWLYNQDLIAIQNCWGLIGNLDPNSWVILLNVKRFVHCPHVADLLSQGQHFWVIRWIYLGFACFLNKHSNYFISYPYSNNSLFSFLSVIPLSSFYLDFFTTFLFIIWKSIWIWIHFGSFLE